MNEDYWKKLAGQWIRLKNQEQNDKVPDAPIISHDSNDGTIDMEIEDQKDEIIHSIVPPHAPSFPSLNWELVNHQQLNPKNKFEKNNFQFTNALQAPSPPLINAILDEQSNLVDMDIDIASDEEASSSNNIESQKKKQLPIWLREGLEKMKRDKLIEDLRCQEEEKLKQDEERRKQMMEEALRELEQEKKCKYDSKSENEEEISPDSVQCIPKSSTSDDEENSYENMMLLVRKTLTTVLLEVTNETILEISNETLSKFRKKASAIIQPAIGLGLGIYSSSSSDEDSESEEKNDNEDLEPESVLKERIRQKTIAFEKRSKDVRDELMKLAKREEQLFQRKPATSLEEANNSKKLTFSSDSEDEQKKLKNNLKDGEEKYEQMIYSITPSLAKNREKKSRFSDLKEGRTTNILMTHVQMAEKKSIDNGVIKQTINISIPPSPSMHFEMPTVSGHHEETKKEKKRRHSSLSSNSSNSSSHYKKHKHKKSNKRVKKSSKKHERSRSREKRHSSHKSDRQSIESKSSIRSSESRSYHSRSRSRSRDKHRRRY